MARLHVSSNGGQIMSIQGRALWGLLSLVPALGCSSSPQPKAYVGLFGDNAVGVVDTGSGKMIHTIAVPAGPHGVVITPDGAKVYVSSDGATTVTVIATATDRIIKTIEVGATPQGLAISPNGKQVLVSGWGSNEAIVIDCQTDSIVEQIPVGRAHNSAISSDDQRAYVGSQMPGAASIAILDLVAGMQLGQVPLQQAPRALDYAPSKRVYFTLTGVDALEVLDPATGQVGTAIPTGASPHHMLATKDGAFELVVSQGAGELEYVDPNNQSVVAHVATGKAPHWIALSSDGRFAYVSNESSNDVSVVDIAHRRVAQTIPVGNAPRKLVVQPGAIPL
jgi:YVTN family beta-propeller protein